MFVKQCISYKYCVPRCSLDKVLGVEIKQTEPARPRCIARDFLGFRIAEPLRSRAWNRSDTTIQLPKHETSNHWPSGEPPEDLRPATEDQPDIEETLVHRSALLDFSEQSSVSLSDSRVPVGKKAWRTRTGTCAGRKECYPWFDKLAAAQQRLRVLEAAKLGRRRRVCFIRATVSAEDTMANAQRFQCPASERQTGSGPIWTGPAWSL